MMLKLGPKGKEEWWKSIIELTKPITKCDLFDSSCYWFDVEPEIWVGKQAQNTYVQVRPKRSVWQRGQQRNGPGGAVQRDQ